MAVSAIAGHSGTRATFFACAISCLAPLVGFVWVSPGIYPRASGERSGHGGGFATANP
jgi:hypothetical protein